MPLYSYQKAPVKALSQQMRIQHANYLQINPQENKQKLTLGRLISGAYNDFHNLMSTSRIASLVVPSVLVAIGVYLIYNQVWPTFIQTVREMSGYYNQSTTALVAGEYIKLNERYSNPGAKYFAELKNSAQEQNILFNDTKSTDYNGNFSLSIPSLSLQNINVTANVDSSIEEVYDRLLEKGLAHFSGTNLPHSDFSAYNIVVYGHSSAGDYYQRTKDPAASFSILSEIRYGSEIIVKFEGEEYKYKFIKGKIVDANDLTILQGSKGQKILTLFTCYPNGNNSKRFVATARLQE